MNWGTVSQRTVKFNWGNIELKNFCIHSIYGSLSNDAIHDSTLKKPNLGLINFGKNKTRVSEILEFRNTRTRDITFKLSNLQCSNLLVQMIIRNWFVV